MVDDTNILLVDDDELDELYYAIIHYYLEIIVWQYDYEVIDEPDVGLADKPDAIVVSIDLWQNDDDIEHIRDNNDEPDIADDELVHHIVEAEVLLLMFRDDVQTDDAVDDAYIAQNLGEVVVDDEVVVWLLIDETKYVELLDDEIDEIEFV